MFVLKATTFRDRLNFFIFTVSAILAGEAMAAGENAVVALSAIGGALIIVVISETPDPARRRNGN